MVEIVRFYDRQQLAERDVAGSLAEQLRQIPQGVLQLVAPSIGTAIARAAHALERVASPDDERGLWPGGYCMLSRIQTEAVWEAIDALPSSSRRNQVHKAFRLILLNVMQNTGQVMLSRGEFSARIGTAPYNVSRVMSTLERMGVIRAERRRLDGVRGPGEAVYFVNPHVAWNGLLEVRHQQADRVAPPLLKLMQGGGSDP